MLTALTTLQPTSAITMTLQERLTSLTLVKKTALKILIATSSTTSNIATLTSVSAENASVNMLQATTVLETEAALSARPMPIAKLCLTEKTSAMSTRTPVKNV